MDYEESYVAYNEARKLGLIAKNKIKSKRQSYNLPFLDDVIKNVEIVSEVYLGIVELALKKVIGTYTSSRSISFAPNFMPLTNEHSEFAGKWKFLFNSIQIEGIREHIKVYEYMNQFYVIEGNKRVSVSKYLDSYSITASVIRLIPKYDEANDQIKLYYEFLNFYRQTKINCIWFSKLNGFKKLLNSLERLDTDMYYDNQYKYFANSIYLSFRKVLYELGGDKLELTTGDVFLEYIKLYAIPQNIEDENVKQNLKSLLKEIESFSRDDISDFNTKPDDESEPSFVSTIFNVVKSKHKTKIAFAYSGDVNLSNWSKAHEKGRLYIQDVFHEHIETSYCDKIPEDLTAYNDFKKLISKGNTMIFATSPAFINAALKTALEFHNVKMFNCSELHSSNHLSTYFGRMYEPRFLIGVIAGSMTKTNIIGYVGSYPVQGVISGINAFALGVRMVNPKARIKVEWANQWGLSESVANCSTKLVKAGADIISHQNTFTGTGFEGEYGLYSLDCDEDKTLCTPKEYIASPIWDWGIFYEKIIRNSLNGTLRNLTKYIAGDARPVSYWWGMDSGIVDICYSKKYVPLETHKLVCFLKKMMMNHSFNPFIGPILDQKGIEKISADNILNPHQIISMDWFVHGIEGEILEKSMMDMEMDIEVTGKMLEI